MKSYKLFLFGYYFQPSFVPDKAVTGILNSLDSDKHVCSLGMTCNLTSNIPLRVHKEPDIGYQSLWREDKRLEQLELFRSV